MIRLLKTVSLLNSKADQPLMRGVNQELFKFKITQIKSLNTNLALS